MKKWICFVLVLLFLVSAAACSEKNENQLFLRVHIRANSNSEKDQQVKYSVKKEIVSYLTPILASCESKSQAVKSVDSELLNLTRIANAVLIKQGLDYACKIKINKEEFPLRSYGEFTFEEGIYDALIIELGSGKGDNWWCMVYPPLCFVGGEDNQTSEITYKSKILEIIQNFKDKYFN